MSAIEKQLPLMLISWLSFPEGSLVLLLGDTSVYAEYLTEKKCQVNVADTVDDIVAQEKHYDFIFMNNAVETTEEPIALLQKIRKYIKPDGLMYLGADNRLGLRYLCGEKDPYTGRVFDGIENYKSVRLNSRKARCYSREELEYMLWKSGLSSPKFYSVFPCLEMAQLVFSDRYAAKEEPHIRYTPMYREPVSVLMREELLFAEIGRMGMLKQMANSYLIECSLDKHHTNAKRITMAYDRGREHACCTVVTNEGRVVKKAVFSEGDKHIRMLADNMEELRRHHIPVVEGEWKNNEYVASYAQGKRGNIYLQEVMSENIDRFVELVDHFRDMLMLSSEIIGEDENGIILKKGYPDMTPLKTIYKNGGFLFFDQESSLPKVPLNAILYRIIDVIYEDDPDRERLLPKRCLWERYGMSEQIDHMRRYMDSVMAELQNRRKLQEYHEAHGRNDQLMEINRKKVMSAIGTGTDKQ